MKLPLQVERLIEMGYGVKKTDEKWFVYITLDVVEQNPEITTGWKKLTICEAGDAQRGGGDDDDGIATCGGKKKPAPKEGEVGDWFCVEDEWVWFPGG